MSLPILYAFSKRWVAGVTPAIEFSGESGAEVDESFTYGGVVSLAHSVNRDLYLGAGFGVFDRLETTAFSQSLSSTGRSTSSCDFPTHSGPGRPARGT